MLPIWETMIQRRQEYKQEAQLFVLDDDDDDNDDDNLSCYSKMKR